MRTPNWSTWTRTRTPHQSGSQTGSRIFLMSLKPKAIGRQDSVPVMATCYGAGVALIQRLASLTPSGRAGVPVAWALYDFANTIYSYAIVSYAMGLWLTDDSRLGAADGQFWFGIANAVSVGLNAA